MRITFMPDDQSGVKKFNVESLEEFTAMTGMHIRGKFEGPGIYVTTDGKPSQADIDEGIENEKGSMNGSLIIR